MKKGQEDAFFRTLTCYGQFYTNELVASFQECQHGSPRPSWRPRAGATCGAVRKIRGTPRQRVGWKAHDYRMFCSCTPERYEPHIHAFFPHVSRGYADPPNSQPVIAEEPQRAEGTRGNTPPKSFRF